jgi:hypothetical protein
MKPGLIVILFLQLSSLRAQLPEKLYQFDLQNVIFSEFSQTVFKKSGVIVFYNEKWVANLIVTLECDSISILNAVKRVIEGSGLEVSEWHDNLVILPGLKLLSELPLYEHVTTNTDTLQIPGQGLTETEERYLTGRKPGATQTITIGSPGTYAGKSKAKILGRVLDEETGEPLISVPVYIVETKTGAITDMNGFFTIILNPGRYNAQIEYLGYAKEKFILEVISEGNFSFNLKKATIQLQEVVVSGELQANIRVKDPGLDQISTQTIKLLPFMMGERDILKASGTLPGIVSTGEGGAGLNVRGSGSDQNAFYLNKIPIYNTSHLFGFFSAFNSDIVKDFSIYKGYIPAQYGGRLASVFNVTTRQGNRKRFTVHGGVSPIAGNLILEGPIIKDTSSFLFSLRSSYSDWILSRIRDTTIRASSANFNDLSGGVNWDLKKTQISLFGYHSYDHFRLSTINNYEYSNDGASLILGHIFNSTLRSELAFITSHYSFSTVDKLELSSAYEHSYKLGQYQARAGFKHVLNANNSLEYGADFTLYNLDRGIVSPFGEKSLLNKVNLGFEKGIENSVYTSGSFDVKPWLNLNIGIRYSVYVPMGPSTVYTYGTGTPIDTRYITDTLQFDRNEPLSWYYEPDIRASANLKTDRDGTVKVAFNQMHQNLFMLNTTTTLAPNTQWKLADYHLRPSSSRQVSLGVFRTIPKNGLEASVEIYYKRSQNYPEFKDGADFLNNPLVETSVLQGSQKAYGIELYIKRSRRKFEGWISYTWSRSIIQVNGEYSWDRINNGEAFPSNYDIPNSLNAVAYYHFTRRIILSSIFTYQTGRPITYPESVFYINGTPYLNYSKRNAYHIPDYFRSDFSLTIEGNLNANKLFHSSLVFTVYNATGRMNPYSVFYNTQEGRIKSFKYSVIGVPIFTVTWQFKLGNYASD